MAEMIKAPAEFNIFEVAPKGFEFTGENRPPKIGEWFALVNPNKGYVPQECIVDDFTSSWLILRKIGAVPAPTPHTYNASVSEIRQGEKFAEDALASTCEALRVELGIKKDTIYELTARVAELEQRLNDRRILLTAEMAAELAGKAMIDDTGHFIYDEDSKCRLFTVAEAEKQALEIYEFFEKHFGGAK